MHHASSCWLGGSKLHQGLHLHTLARQHFSAALKATPEGCACIWAAPCQRACVSVCSRLGAPRSSGMKPLAATSSQKRVQLYSLNILWAAQLSHITGHLVGG
jgi:hypothetical protein